ncbi:MAG: 1-acyl-sn-glycerol-3-phosphate acyltransferase [Clostridia bacterium]|nr:1-acyl-sn-glycerol-3-phosphate acyltransferase [Clostridia bacterium]
MNKQIIPIFYACDDAFVKYTVVSLYSIIKNASTEYDYKIHILHSGISEESKKRLSELENDNFKVFFHNIKNDVKQIYGKLPVRDYYSKTTYYRFFIAEMFPEYKRVIYTDGDTIFNADVSELYFTDIEDAYVGACRDLVFTQVDLYGDYAEKVVGVSRYNIFNAGLLLINCDQFRKHAVYKKFRYYLKMYDFVVTQDQDYLNLICKDHVFFLDQRWNDTMFSEPVFPDREAKMIHCNMTGKPWHYRDCRCAEYFWKYAKETSVYDEIAAELEGYTDECKKADARVLENINRLAEKEIKRSDNFVNLQNSERSEARRKIVKKIEDYEEQGRFTEDVYDDPPTETLMPENIDYLRKGVVSSAKADIAYAVAKRFSKKLSKDKKLLIKKINGLEKLNGIEGGAVLTCNHFNEFDSFAIHYTFAKAKLKDKKLYTVIREGNYTTFKGFYGYLMRNCYTLPLSSNHKTMRKFSIATEQILKKGDFILIYPEQSMWWNYRKPKPLQKGAFVIAAKNNVPIVPCFITMQDSDMVDPDGFFVQEYTVNIGDPIYPDEELKYVDRVTDMLDKTFAFNKETYEKKYGIPLYYTKK